MCQNKDRFDCTLVSHKLLCCYSILPRSCFNTSLSNSALNSLFRKFDRPYNLALSVLTLESIVLNCNCKFVEIREPSFKCTTVLETSRRVC